MRRQLSHQSKRTFIIDATRYRAPKTTLKHGPQEPSYGFLDGDFLEQLLPHFEESTDVLGAVFDGESVATREEFRKVIENLQAVHL